MTELSLTLRSVKGSPITVEEHDADMLAIETEVNALIDNVGGETLVDVEARVEQNESDISDLESAVSTNTSDISDNVTAIGLNTTHRGLTDNPHSVTASQVGLSNVSNNAQLKAGASDFHTNFSTKETPVDADEVIIEDSADSYAKKNLTWANIKATLKTYMDTLYSAIGHYHSKLVASDGSPDPALSVDATGKVGIGTASPSRLLHLLGGYGWARFGVDASNYTEIGHHGSNSVVNAVGAGKLSFRHDGAEKMAVDDSGNLTLSGTVDGRDIATDGSKLDNIEASADVTDATNVASAGAVMDSDISPTEGILRKTGAGAYTAIKSNLTAVVEPTVDDDTTAGYSVGSLWIDTVLKVVYTCADDTEGAAVWSAGGGGGLAYEVVTEATNAVSGTGYLLNPSAALELTLPSSPEAGDTVGVVDAYNMASTYALTIGRNGENIEGVAEDLTIDVDGSGFTLVYCDATRGWEIVSEIGNNSVTTFSYEDYTDRGDPSSWDFNLGALTTDGSFHDLDLSGIVGSKAVLVHLYARVADDIPGSELMFREKGNSNSVNTNTLYAQAAGITIGSDVFVMTDSNGVIEYSCTNTTFNAIYITIRGWFTPKDETAVGSGNVYSPEDLTDNALIRGDGGSKNAQTSTVLVSDDGEMTNPSQPCFLVRPSETQLNLATGSDVTIVFGSEIFDVGNNFASNTFTAPITGKYFLEVTLYLNAVDIDATYYLLNLITSNHNFYYALTPNFSADLNLYTITMSVVEHMDENDTAYVTLKQVAGAAQLDITTSSHFSGHLIC